MNYTHYKRTTGPTPQNIFVVDMRQEQKKFFSELTLKGIQKYAYLNKKIIIIVNKKGFSSGMICTDCGHIPYCKQCDIPIAYHINDQKTMIGMCHICKTTYPYTHECSNCGGHNVSDYGLGTQKVAEYITKYTGKQTCIIESETANSPKKIHTLLSSINTPTPPILIATNILITPLHNWKSDLLIYLDADRGMTNPDFMSYSDTFHNIYSGIRYHQSPHIIIQTFDPQKPPIYFAVRNDPDGYKTYEQQYRKNHSYPPYGELCVLIYKHEKEQNLLTKIQKIYQELLYLQEKYDQSLEIFSTPPLIYKTFGKLRYHIVIKGRNIRPFIDEAEKQLRISQQGFQIDREPRQIF